jgi:leucyl/phenylalanyl-tRNA--protein transferase
MFSTVNDASKVAFYGLVQQLRVQNYTLLDSQYLNDFTEQLGAGEIKRSEYLSLLSKALIQDCIFLP